ncbi:hypothetical protein Cs7R123_79550 [Catellatospora sp. TT07R-123]|nr:hypothetical protein Cs7R123_79550 [Catellatospora sp. TT07R-123]
MREIAEQLGITKAALYYHFESKDAIVTSLFDGLLRALDELLDAAAGQPPSAQRSSDLLGGWLALTAGQALPVIRFAAANQTVLRTALSTGREGATQRFERATQLMLRPDASLSDRLRVRTALLAGHVTVLAARGTDAEDADILTSALSAAASLTAGLFPAPMLPDVTGHT